MKHKLELDNLLSAIRYCAMADNNKDILERWNRLNVTEHLEALANVTFFDDWQTIEQMDFALHQAEKINAECSEIDSLLAPFWESTPETMESRYLLGLWSGIEIHILSEFHELREYIKGQEKNNFTITPWLKHVFGNDDLAQNYLDKVKIRLEESPTQIGWATIDAFCICKPQYYKHESNKRLAEEIQLCTGVILSRANFTHWGEGLKKFPKADK